MSARKVTKAEFAEIKKDRKMELSILQSDSITLCKKHSIERQVLAISSKAVSGLYYLTKRCNKCYRERYHNNDKLILKKVEDYGSAEKEISRIRAVRLCPMRAENIACLPGPRMTEINHYLGYREPKNIWAIERDPVRAKAIRRKKYPEVQVIEREFNYALYELSMKDIQLDFCHADLEFLPTEKNLEPLAKSLLKHRVMRKGGILVINLVNGRENETGGDRISSIEEQLSKWARLLRIDQGKYYSGTSPMNWGAWRILEYK